MTYLCFQGCQEERNKSKHTQKVPEVPYHYFDYEMLETVPTDSKPDHLVPST